MFEDGSPDADAEDTPGAPALEVATFIGAADGVGTA
jgi:hypothetical protein